MKYKKIYVAATSQHIGKTTTTLGLIHALQQKNINVGYCKPVGQQFIELEDIGLPVDKDTVLFADFMKFEILPHIHSPIILGKGATSKYLDNPENFNYPQELMNASQYLENQHDMVVYEGTGHPGVGAVVKLSNAEVAKRLNAGVIMVVKGGIGNTIDRLHLSLSIFKEKKVPVIGVIVNKVLPSKMDKIRHYVGGFLDSIDMPLLGLIPYDQTLSNPLMITIKHAVNGEVLMNPQYLYNQVEDIIAGSLVDKKELKRFQNLLLVVSITRLSEAIEKIQAIAERAGHTKSPLSGIIVTNNGQVKDDAKAYINYHKIPLIRTELDTFGSVVKTSRIEVKINTHTPWKVRRATELVQKHVNLDILFKNEQ